MEEGHGKDIDLGVTSTQELNKQSMISVNEREDEEDLDQMDEEELKRPFSNFKAT